jgi:uncharacterized membrane protein
MRRGITVFGHPLHAMLVHAPLALLGTAPLWDVIGVFRGEPIWWTISFWNIALGLLAALIAATAGTVDFAAIEPGGVAETVAARHMWIMVTAVALYGISLVIRGGTTAPEGATRIYALLMEGLGLLGLAIGGWCGAELVYRHGIGVNGRVTGAGNRAEDN